MDDRTFTNNNQVPSGNEPSDLLKQFIEELSEEIVLNGAAFDNYKKSLRRYCEHEHFDGDGLIANLTEFFDNMEELKSSASKAAVKLAYLQARECYISAPTVDKLVEGLATVRANKAKEEAEREKRKRAESERKAKEEAKRRAREEVVRKAKEKSGKRQTTGELNGHEWVDLGLPSGTLWATCNIGATTPEDYGDYLSWKEAVANLGVDWQMPTEKQWKELMWETKSIWTERKGIAGRLFTANNGNVLFLPAAGERYFTCFSDASRCGYYRANSLGTDAGNAGIFHLSSDYYGMSYSRDISFYRYSGVSVRLVHPCL